MLFLILHRIYFHLDPHASYLKLTQHISTVFTETRKQPHATPSNTLNQNSTSDAPIYLDFSFTPHVISIHVKINPESYNAVSFGESQPIISSSLPPNTEIDERQITSDFSIAIQYDLHQNKLSCTFSGSSKLFNQTTLETLAHRFHTLCQQLFSSSFNRQLHPIYTLSILLPNEQHILTKLNNYTIKPTDTPCIHQAFIQQALRHPHKVAIIFDHQSLTYNQLLRRVQHLSLILINDKRIQVGDVVCQYVDRSIDMIVGIMSIMMAGGIYAPLNVTDPLDRIQSLVHQVNAKLILVNQISCESLASFTLPIVDISQVTQCDVSLSDEQLRKLSQVDVRPDHISHIVFTSGSTGVPKAVQIRHRNFMDYVQSHIIQTDDVVLQLTSSTFDSHLDDIHGALVRGAQLVLLKSGGHFDFDYLTQTIYEQRVTYVGPVPSWLNALAKFLSENDHARHRIKSVRYWYLGGNKL